MNPSFLAIIEHHFGKTMAYPGIVKKAEVMNHAHNIRHLIRGYLVEESKADYARNLALSLAANVSPAEFYQGVARGLFRRRPAMDFHDNRRLPRFMAYGLLMREVAVSRPGCDRALDTDQPAVEEASSGDSHRWMLTTIALS